MIALFDEVKHFFYKKLDLPELFEQKDDHSCGFWTAAAVLSYFGKPVGLDFVLDINLTENGTTQTKLVKALRNNGVSANILYDQPPEKFFNAVDEGKPVVVYCHKYDHWSLFIGYSPCKRYIVVYDREIGEVVHPVSYIRKNFKGFAIICNAKFKNVSQVSQY